MSRAFLAISILGLNLAVTAGPATLQAADASAATSGAATAQADTPDLFAAMKSGDLSVRFIPRDDTQARLILTNNTKVPVTVRMPDVFAASPVLANIGGLGNGLGPDRSPQTVGTSSRRNQANFCTTLVPGQMPNFAPQGRNGNFAPGNGQGFFSVPPEKTITLRLTTACLEYGKPDPKPSIEYTIRPISEVNDDPKLLAVLCGLGDEDPDQRAIQAAVWHLTDDLSWDKIAGIRNRHVNGTSDPLFSRRQVDRAKKIFAAAEKDVAAQPSRSVAKSMVDAKPR